MRVDLAFGERDLIRRGDRVGREVELRLAAARLQIGNTEIIVDELRRDIERVVTDSRVDDRRAADTLHVDDVVAAEHPNLHIVLNIGDVDFVARQTGHCRDSALRAEMIKLLLQIDLFARNGDGIRDRLSVDDHMV